jgi:large subunit ribosomal protein L18
MLKRRKKKKTDYKQRLGLLKSKKLRLVVRRSLNNIHLQIIEYEPKGDKTLIKVSSKNLRKYGWKAHGGNLPSAYLCGLLIGLMAMKKDINEAVLDVGLQTSIRGASIYAAAMGARDAGLIIDLNEEILPDMDRISGIHISNYAKLLKSNPEKYNRQFSYYLKNNLDPERLPKHFDEIKNKILEEFGFKIEEFKKVSEKEIRERESIKKGAEEVSETKEETEEERGMSNECEKTNV